MDLGLRDKVVMVTGGAGRIGPVICQAFAGEGALVAVLDIAAGRAEDTAANLRRSGSEPSARTCARCSVVDVSGGSHTGRLHVPLPRSPE